MIYSVEEIENIVPSLVGKSDERVKFLLENAETKICSVLRVKNLSKFSEIPMQIKTACVWIIEHAVGAEKSAEMKSFRQGNISVDYVDEYTRKENLNDNLKHLLAPLMSVKIWS